MRLIPRSRIAVLLALAAAAIWTGLWLLRSRAPDWKMRKVGGNGNACSCTNRIESP